MRISGDFKSPEFWGNSFRACPNILLDGQPIEHVVEADDENGMIIVQVYRDGQPVIDWDRQQFVHKPLYGRVEIVGQRI